MDRGLVGLYWQIGRDILARPGREGWGTHVIERPAQDLRNAFPDMKGFSLRNLKYKRAFPEAWPEVISAIPQAPRSWSVGAAPSPRCRGPQCPSMHVAPAYRACLGYPLAPLEDAPSRRGRRSHGGLSYDSNHLDRL